MSSTCLLTGARFSRCTLVMETALLPSSCAPAITPRHRTAIIATCNSSNRFMAGSLSSPGGGAGLLLGQGGHYRAFRGYQELLRRALHLLSGHAVVLVHDGIDQSRIVEKNGVLSHAD